MARERIRKITIRLKPGEHDDILAAAREAGFQDFFVKAARFYLEQGNAAEGAEPVAKALRRVYPGMSEGTARALAQSSVFAPARRLFAAIPPQATELDAPLLLEAALLLLRRVLAFYRRSPAAEPDELRGLLSRLRTFLPEDEG